LAGGRDERRSGGGVVEEKFDLRMHGLTCW
jgi:hypothetical protein